MDILFQIQINMRGPLVDCTVKTPVALQLGDAASDSVRPGVYIIDIVLAEPVNVSKIKIKLLLVIEQNASNRD